MNIFIGSSSSEEINEVYKERSSNLIDLLSKENNLVFGSANRGLMGICYRKFKENNRKIIGVCYELYKDDLKELELDEVHMVNNLEESNKKLEQLSDIILFLPGSFGTLSEFIYILETKRTNLHNKEIIVFNIDGFFDNLINQFNIINNNVSKKYDYKKLCNVFDNENDINEYINNKKNS